MSNYSSKRVHSWFQFKSFAFTSNNATVKSACHRHPFWNHFKAFLFELLSWKPQFVHRIKGDPAFDINFSSGYIASVDREPLSGRYNFSVKSIFVTNGWINGAKALSPFWKSASSFAIWTPHFTPLVLMSSQVSCCTHLAAFSRLKKRPNSKHIFPLHVG